MKPSEVLTKALELFGPNGERWVKCSPRSDDEDCAITAIYVSCGDLEVRCQAVDALERAAHVEPFSWLGHWNDSQNHFSAIKAAFEQAIKNCQQAEGQ